MSLWTPTPATRYCECCRTRPADQRCTTAVRGGLVDGHEVKTVWVQAMLCAHCAHGVETETNAPARRHAAGFCQLAGCGLAAGHIWHCQLVEHFRDKHQVLLGRLTKDGFEDVEQTPQPEFVGTVEWEQRDADSPKKWF